MDIEYVRYRQATMAERLRMTKRFTKWYFRTYKPMTRLEKSDLTRSKQEYTMFTTIFALVFGFGSFMFRKVRIGSVGAEGVSKESKVLATIFTDAVCAFAGWNLGHFFACDYIYKHRQYVIERDLKESELNYQGRFNYKPLKQELYQDYPLAA